MTGVAGVVELRMSSIENEGQTDTTDRQTGVAGAVEQRMFSIMYDSINILAMAPLRIAETWLCQSSHSDSVQKSIPSQV